MIRSLWISKTGMEAQQTSLDTISHNLANVGTNGFKRGHVVFEDLIYQNLRQAGANSGEQTLLPTGLQVGLGVRPVALSRNFSQGNLQQTGGNLDVAVKGEGFFEVQLPDGAPAYTRDGSFQRSASGQIVTNNGYVVAPGLTIPADALSVTIAADGNVSAMVPVAGGSPVSRPIGQLQMNTFINPGGLEPRGQNLFTETPASGAPIQGVDGAAGVGTLQQGYVETSNVNVVEELVSMIQTQRAYEINSKAIQTSDQMLQRLSQL